MTVTRLIMWSYMANFGTYSSLFSVVTAVTQFSLMKTKATIVDMHMFQEPSVMTYNLQAHY